MPYGPLTLDPASMVLHYGQEIFEGLKAYRQPDGSIASFRPDANAARFRASAARLAMAQLPDELFLASLAELLDVDREWVPPAGGEESMYLRPFMMAAEVGLGVRPSAEYLYCLIASPAGPYFPGGVKPVDVWLSTDYTRAALGGTGTAKCGGNYAASLLPAGPGRRARLRAGGLPRRRGAPLDRRDGLEQPVLRLRLGRARRGGDALADRQHPARDHPRLAAGAGQGAGLPGHRAADLVGGVAATGAADGRITEVFGCGTAAVITPIGRVQHHGGEVVIGDGQPGPVGLRLRTMLTDIQRGTAPDTHSWMRTLVPA